MKKITCLSQTNSRSDPSRTQEVRSIAAFLRDTVRINCPLDTKRCIAGIALWLILSPIGHGLLQSLGEKLSFEASRKGASEKVVYMHITTSDPEDLAKHAKKVLIITIIYGVLLAGLITIALKHSKRSAELPKATLELPQLKTYTVQAALAGAHALRENPQQARKKILQKYASLRGFPSPETLVDKEVSMRVEIGPDTLTLNTPYQGDKSKLEVIARNGRLGARVVIAPSGVTETMIFDERTSKLLRNEPVDK